MGLSSSDSAVFRDLLINLRARVRGDVEQLTTEALGNGSNDASKTPNHLAERGTDAYEQDFSLRFAENDEALLKEIGAAIKKIDAGEFGLCETCVEEGKPSSKALIKKTRLKALPYARNCIECERKREELFT